MAKKKNNNKQSTRRLLEEYAAPLDTGQTKGRRPDTDPKVPHG